MSERDGVPADQPAQEIEGEARVIEEAEIAEAPAPPAAAPPRTPWLATLLSLLAIAGVAVGLWFGHQYWQGLQASLARMNHAIETASRQQAELQGRLAETRKAFEAQQAQVAEQERLVAEQEQLLAEQERLLAEQNRRLDEERAALGRQGDAMREALEAVDRKLGSSTNDWMAAEAAYLMRVASHRLYLERDLETALKALEEADARLRDTGDPAWIGVRERLAAEIAALKGVARPDRAGLSARLGGMAEQVGGLRLAGLAPERPAPGTGGETAAPEEKSFETLLRDSWEGFKSVMVVRHRERPVAAMIAPDQQQFIYQNLRLQFEAARLAMLRGDAPLYRASMETARRWLADFFDPVQPAYAAVVAELDELARVDVAPRLPDITGSLRLLGERMAARQAVGGTP